MADVNRGDRPLSPHLTVYDQSYTGTLSILHRISGVALTLGTLLVVWWLLAASADDENFALVNGILTSWFGLAILFASTLAMAYHTLNGIRHLWWDMGYGYELQQVRRSGQAVLGGSVALTVLFWLFAV
ncbi:MAG: succinate dehydrogenase, cytochrome b556 subunit [Paracoccaceae bacterium]